MKQISLAPLWIQDMRQCPGLPLSAANTCGYDDKLVYSSNLFYTLSGINAQKTNGHSLAPTKGKDVLSL